MTKENPNILNTPIVFVDVETTGFSPEKDKIIDIALIKVINGKVVDEFNSFVNPQTVNIPSYISYMTGIDSNKLESAPIFNEIASDVSKFLKGSIFAAHNVNFDYGFVKAALFGEGINFNSKRLCTVRLYKSLVPGKRKYGLDSLINHFGLTVKERHSAYGDTKALVDFWKIALNEYPEQILTEVFTNLVRRPTVPPKILLEDINKLPNTPGVYIFSNSTNIPLYIGKSIKIKQRVLSHFANVTSNLDQKIIKETYKIKHHKTAGEFGALILESQLIKKYMPLYNKRLRRAKKMTTVLALEKVTDYSKVIFKDLDKVEEKEIKNILGVFKTKSEAENFVRQICLKNDLCQKTVGVESSNNSCFKYQLGQCNGACVGKESFLQHNIRYIQAFSTSMVKSWPYKGAVGIQEQSTDGLTEIHVLNNWKYLGKYTSDHDDINLKSEEYSFNYDEYKLIKKFLQSTKTKSRIVPLN